MSSLAQPYRAPAPPASRASAARRVTRAQVALITAASLGAAGALLSHAPHDAPPPITPTEAPGQPLTPLPLPPVVRAEPRAAVPLRPPPASAPQAPSGMEDARACLLRGGANAEVNACVVNALRGRATTEPELRLLCVTYRQMGDRANSVACMRRYLLRYPGTRSAAQFEEYILGG